MRKKTVKISEFELLDKQERCCVCGKLTNMWEKSYQAFFCGEDCVIVMDRASVTGKRYPLK